MIKNIILIFFLLLIIPSCINKDQEDKKDQPILSAKKFYRLRMKVDNMGNIQYGLVLLKKKDLYTIEFTALSNMDFFSFNTCSTNITRYDAGGLIFKKKSTKVNFKPNEIEQEMFCSAKVQVADDKMEAYTAAYIVFENPRTKYPSEVICGSKTDNFKNGSSICELPEGNYMRIKFDKPFKMQSKSCQVIEGESQVFTFKVQAGFCFYKFESGEDKHRLVTYGSNDDNIK